MVFNLNEIELEEDAIGIDDDPHHIHFLSGHKEKVVYNHKRYGHDAMIKKFNETDPLFYWNIILSKDQIVS